MLEIEIGQYSHQGRKAENQDFHAASIPQNYLRKHKGIAVALADGISSSNVSHIASKTAVSSFLNDYFSTPETWTVKTSALRVIDATNTWLYAQTRQSQYRYDKDRGYVCTLSALVLKGQFAHLFHIGDSRIYRLQAGQLEQLTTDHRVWLSQQENYLSRALGVSAKVDVDYQNHQIYVDDIFLFMTDGVYEFVEAEKLKSFLALDADLDQIAQLIVEYAFEQGSDDNLTIQIIKIKQLADQEDFESHQATQQLADVPELKAKMQFDGFEIVRELHQNHRSRLYLATDTANHAQCALKVPAVEIQQDQRLIEQFMLEEWVAKRVQSPYVLSAYSLTRPRHYCYQCLEYVQGQTLKQWLIDQGLPLPLGKVRGIIEQVAKGLQSLHRLEILHQDIRPENIMIDEFLNIKIIDFGASQVAGLKESAPAQDELPLGAMAYLAPEYLVGGTIGTQADQYALAVMTYYMLTGQLPYGTAVMQAKSKKDLKNLKYIPAICYVEEIPLWLDATLQKALSVQPQQRYQEISEFIYDLQHPNPQYLGAKKPSLIERHPVKFWQSLSGILFLLLVLSLLWRHI